MNITPSDRPGPALLPANAVGALVVGTLTGSALLAVGVIATALVTGLVHGAPDEALGGGLLIAVLFLLFSLPIWAAGLIVVGIPGWIALHALGWRSRWAGATFGGGATFIAALILGLRFNALNRGNPWEVSLMAGVLALIGAVVGWMVVRHAYDQGRTAR